MLLYGGGFKVPNKHSTYGRVKTPKLVKVVMVKMVIFVFGLCHYAHYNK